jgi:hypothetical protein
MGRLMPARIAKGHPAGEEGSGSAMVTAALTK